MFVTVQTALCITTFHAYTRIKTVTLRSCVNDSVSHWSFTSLHIFINVYRITILTLMLT